MSLRPTRDFSIDFERFANASQQLRDGGIVDIGVASRVLPVDTAAHVEQLREDARTLDHARRVTSDSDPDGGVPAR